MVRVLVGHDQTRSPSQAAQRPKHRNLPILPGVLNPLPSELQREITRLDLALPDPAELELVLDGIIGSAVLK